MRWEGQRESTNVEDRRGMSPARVGGVGGLGIGGIILVLAVSYFTGTNPLTLLNMLDGVQNMTESSTSSEPGRIGAPSDQLGKFASVVLADTETTWTGLLGQGYENPRMVLFSGAVQSACGTSSSAVGPFYCPGDHRLYLDLSFFNEMSQRLGAPGDFAQAYVIAHEVGHHVQNLLGIAATVHRLQRQGSETEGNALSVRMELQADCFAGVWGHHAKRDRNLIEPGDFEEGLRAASAIGDDRLQKMSRGQVQPESWTHGSSEQRTAWLRKGLETGDPKSCDTFAGGHL
ncbi:MAG: neutral zinc metallopeptidase [Nitrospirota bacterium]|nr:neutral zinc metallopeptidase [Nitrospirota bacterium]MDP2383696.1 neutral zinc metallopeptidase [Nitrospirota bacterium]MDP3596684.1 neutral zinc metallopeptidase [Nitrospirota bacterium]